MKYLVSSKEVNREILEARERLLALMKKGFCLKGERFHRDDLHERKEHKPFSRNSIKK